MSTKYVLIQNSDFVEKTTLRAGNFVTHPLPVSHKPEALVIYVIIHIVPDLYAIIMKTAVLNLEFLH